MKREPPALPRLYRQKWMTLLREQAAGSKSLTPSLVTDLWKFTRDVFLLRPEEERPLINDDEYGRPRRAHFGDVVSNYGLEWMEDLGTAEIVRSDDTFLPGQKVTKKMEKERRKKLQEVLNLTFDHPEYGRQRLGSWTPFDAARFVTPELAQQNLKLAQRGSEVSELIARCPIPNVPMIDQINAEPDDDDGE